MLNYKNPRKALFYKGFQHYLPQHCLYLRPLPHGKNIPGFWWHFRAFEGVWQPFFALFGFREHLGNLAEGI